MSRQVITKITCDLCGAENLTSPETIGDKDYCPSCYRYLKGFIGLNNILFYKDLTVYEKDSKYYMTVGHEEKPLLYKILNASHAIRIDSNDDKKEFDIVFMCEHVAGEVLEIIRLYTYDDSSSIYGESLTRGISVRDRGNLLYCIQDLVAKGGDKIDILSIIKPIQALSMQEELRR